MNYIKNIILLRKQFKNGGMIFRTWYRRFLYDLQNIFWRF